MKKVNVKGKLSLAISVFYLFIALCANAQVVAISCIENEHAEKTPSDVTSYFENELLASLFDEGVIVTSLSYKKGTMEDFKNTKINNLQVESEPDFVALIYFIYDKNKRYDEFRRKNLLPCTQISCRILNVKTGAELEKHDFVFADIEEKLMFKKVDFCFLKIKEIILKSIRRKV